MTVIDRGMKCASVNITRSAKPMRIATHINTTASAHMLEWIGIGMVKIDTFAEAKSTTATPIGTNERIGTSTAAVIGRRLAIEGVTAQTGTTIMESTITSPLATTMTITILAFAITDR
jgi:predicted thioesterase